MNRVLENKFFREFQHHGAAIMSLDMMHFEYCGIGNGTAGRPDYPDGVLAEIRQRTESFDTWPWGGVENCSPLMDEIADNIALCQAGSREAYVEEMLRKMQTWTFRYSLAKDKLDAVSNTIQIHTIEDFFWTWRNAFRTFAEKLAVILAKLGINLLEIQNRCGISIIEHLDADELWQDFGTRELANFYLSKIGIALPTLLTTPKAQAVLKRGTDCGLLDEKFMPIPQMTKAQMKVFAIHAAIECGFKDTCYKPFEVYWNVSKLAQVREVDSREDKLDFVRNLFPKEIQKQAKLK